MSVAPDPGKGSVFRAVNSYERRLVYLLGAATFFNRYDENLLSLVLLQIQEDLLIQDSQVAFLGSVVRLGAIPGLLAAFLSDRWGRRKMLLWTIAGYTVFTTATAFSSGFGSFLVFQLLARMFMAAESTLALVVIVEEFRPENRGLGIGILGTLAVLGSGLSMILFGTIDVFPMGWRGLYLVGALPLLLVIYFRRGLPETRRFEQVATASATSVRSNWLSPFRDLVNRYPRRFAAMATVTFLWGFSNAPVDFLLPKFMQEVQGWTPAEFAAIAVAIGAFGITGQPIAGWLTDRYGRKRWGVPFILLEPLMAILLYNTAGAIVAVLYFVWVFASVANDVVLRTFRLEIFPTEFRSTAAAAVAIAGTLGGVLGLAAEGALYPVFASHWPAVALIASAGLAMPVIVLWFFPETSGRTLEEISPNPTTGRHG